MDSATYAQDHRAPAVNRAELDEAVRKAFRHLLPLLFACYVMAYIDRINFGFAAITMNSDLGVTLTQFGLAGTLFYAAYFFSSRFQAIYCSSVLEHGVGLPEL